MDWGDLRFVLELGRAGTLAGAAKTLGVNHTTVARRVKAFEKDLGLRVFDHLPRGHVPTPAGEELLVVAERVEEELLNLDRAVLGQDTQLRGTVRVATVDVTAMGFAADFAEFAELYPEIDLQVTTGSRLHNLTRREADVAIRFTNSPPETLVGRRLGVMKYAPYAAQSLVDRIGKGAPLGDYPWLVWDESMNAAGSQEWMRTNVPDARRVMSIDSTSTAMDMVHKGLGAMLITHTVSRELVQLGPWVEGFDMDVWMLTHPDLRPTARVRAFMNFMGPRIREACVLEEGD